MNNSPLSHFGGADSRKNWWYNSHRC